jgi:hypothetical protein
MPSAKSTAAITVIHRPTTPNHAAVRRLLFLPEHDYTQYRYWTRKAAEQGHQDALREVNRRDYRDP